MYDLPTSLTFSGSFLVIHLPRFSHISFLPSTILVAASGVVSDVVPSLESRVTHGSVDEIGVRLVPKPDLRGHDGPFEKA